MSIQWAIAAGILYLEIFLVLLLVLPIASARTWQKVFRSRILSALGSQVQIYFYILLFTLALLCLDAIREMRKYANADAHDQGHNHQLDHEMQVNMRLFRAQRNFYISGFSLFLSLVIRRLVTLISTLATMQAQSEAAMKQAVSATKAAKNLMSGEAADNSTNEAHDKEKTALKEEIEALKSTLEKEKKDKAAIKKQAESTNAEYDRLTSEFSKLQKKAETAGGSEGKKDE